MSSRKNLKKDINHTIELLYTDLILYKVYVIGADKKAADNILAQIIDVQHNYLSRAGHCDGKNIKGRAHAYYKKLIADFKGQIQQLANDINKLP